MCILHHSQIGYSFFFFFFFFFMEQSNWLFKQLQNPKIQMELKSNWVIATEQKQCQIGYSFFFIFFIYGIVKLAIQTVAKSKNSNGVEV
jgi:hypothetical protein